MIGRLVAVLTLLAAAPASADEALDELAPARAAFEDRDYAGALELALPLAESGDARAQALIGVMHRTGTLGVVDRAEAVRWLARAADQGEAAAQFNLGLMYFERQAAPPEGARTLEELQGAAAAKFRAAAEQGHAEAQLYLGYMVAEGLGVDPDPVEGYKWYQLAAWQRGDLAAAALDRLGATLSAVQLEDARAEASGFRAKLAETPEVDPTDVEGP